MAKKKLNIGMIGYGFMGRAHSNAFRKVNNFFDLEYQPVLKAACARNAEKAQAFADKWGYESIETDWRALIERDDIDCIDIGSPNNTHHEIVLAAAAKGKMILCEKPLAMDAKEGEEMTAAVEKAGVPNMVWYNYRRVHDYPGEAPHRRRPSRARFPLPRQIPAGLDHQPGAAPGRRGLWRLDAAVAGAA